MSSAWGYHIFIIEKNIESIKTILAKLHNEYKLIRVDLQKIEIFYEQELNNVFTEEGKEGWKIYKILNSPYNFNYVKFEYYLNPDSYPDDHFGEALIELSKLTDKEIYYVWHQHIDIGFEVYKDGQCLNSIIISTHGPDIKVDGKAATIKIPFFSQIFGRSYRYYMDKYSKFPPHIAELVNKIRFNKLPWQYIGEYVVFIKKDISNFDSLIAKFTRK